MSGGGGWEVCPGEGKRAGCDQQETVRCPVSSPPVRQSLVHLQCLVKLQHFEQNTKQNSNPFNILEVISVVKTKLILNSVVVLNIVTVSAVFIS